jgi:hypothetical protein
MYEGGARSMLGEIQPVQSLEGRRLRLPSAGRDGRATKFGTGVLARHWSLAIYSVVFGDLAPKAR